jgi:uncharacterized protein (TIGR03437 family)
MRVRLSALFFLLCLCACGIASAQTPTIQNIVNGGSQLPSLCPGVLALINGSNLGPTTVFNGQATGLTVTVNGENSTVYFSSATQVGFEIPFDIPVGSATVVLKFFETTSAPFQIQLVAFAPAVLTAIQNGSVETLFMRNNGTMGSSQNPANPGEAISVFMVGLGPTNPLAAPGEIPTSPSNVTNLITSTIAGEPAKVVFAALTNTLKRVGVYQVYFTVPLDLPTGSYPFIATIKGFNSPVAQIPVANLGVAVSQVGFTFQAVQGGGTPAPGSFRVINGTNKSMTFTLTASTISGGSWLRISTNSGTIIQSTDGRSTSSPPITVTANPSGLTPGTYYGSIRVDAPIALNSPAVVSVVLNVAPAATPPGPVVQPTGLVFLQVEGANPPTAQAVSISNASTRSIDFSVTATVTGALNWFQYSPFLGTVTPAAPVPITVTVVPGLRAGLYRGSLAISFGATTRTIDLLLVVTPSSDSKPSSEDMLNGRTAAALCTPTKLLPVFTLLGNNFSTSVAWPTNVEVNVLDDCGTPMTDGGVAVTFSNGDPALSLLSTGDGKWSSTWTAVNPRSSALLVTATAVQLSSGLKGSAQVGGGAQDNPGVPILFTNGAVNAGSFSSSASPSPGELVSVFGSSLADGFEQAQVLPLRTTMQNATLLLGGRLLPLVFTSAGQINVQIPYDLPPGTVQQMIAQRGTQLSVPQPVRIRASEAAVFSTDSTGKGQGHVYHITNAGLQVLADASNPVTAGDVLVIYCTGFGNVSPAVTAGTAVPSDALRNTLDPVTLTIGGVDTQVLFAGLTPGLTGLYQINVVVPTGVTPGSQVPVVVAVDGATGPPVTIAVK